MTAHDTPPAELPPQYDSAASEAAIYEQWMAAGAFTADAAASSRAGGGRDPFTIVIPPPNVTAILHVGHGLNNTVQDVVVRWRRMAGDEALWVPGTDHAGIATQNVVEKQLAAEGKTRFDVGRAAFVERTAAFVERTGGVILQQLPPIAARFNPTAICGAAPGSAAPDGSTLVGPEFAFRDGQFHLLPPAGAARELGLTRRGLYLKLERYQLSATG